MMIILANKNVDDGEALTTMVYGRLYTYSPSPDHKLNWWSVDGESDCRDSLLTNSMQTSWSVDGESDCQFHRLPTIRWADGR